ncbi:hypothetical protein [Rothia sp. P5766]|uniref:hypothetical protein n=1 Tax=Rothia sp. P5766 TaxID=3402656 RepID=UPI003AE78D5C
MNTSKKTVLVACSVASLALLPVQLHDEGSQAMALPAEMLPMLATSAQVQEVLPTNPEPTPSAAVEPPLEPLPSDAPVPREDPVPTPTEDPVSPTEPVPTPTEPAPSVQPVPTPTEEPVPPEEPAPTPTEDPVSPTEPVPTPTEPAPSVQPVPTPTENPVPPTDPEPTPVTPLPPVEPAPLPSSEPVQPQPVPVPAEPVNPAPAQSQEPMNPSNRLATTQQAPVPVQASTDRLAPAPSLQVLGAEPPATMDADTSKVNRSPVGSSVLGLTSAPQQNYSGTPDWVEGFLNASDQNDFGDTANNSNQAAGVIGAEAQGYQFEPTGGSNVFQRGISIVTGARPLLIFSGVAVAGLALVVFNFVWRNRSPKA